MRVRVSMFSRILVLLLLRPAAGLENEEVEDAIVLSQDTVATANTAADTDKRLSFQVW